jgi:ABC-type transporter Mla maintaining outer membrane lipid asymmetry permease subunit MlaE
VRIVALHRRIMLAATIGAGPPAQLGAMRVAEIDAVNRWRCTVLTCATWLIAGLIAIIPLYSRRCWRRSSPPAFHRLHQQPVRGLYDHYFNTFWYRPICCGPRRS